MQLATHARIFLATVLAGLEDIAADEITVKLQGAVIREMTRGKILFEAALPLDQILQLRGVDNLYILVGRFSVGPHKADLATLRQSVAHLSSNLDAAAAMVEPATDKPTFVVNASRKGRQTYSRFDAADAAMQGIADELSGWVIGAPEQHNLEFRLDIEDTSALLSLRLTSADFRFRGPQRLFTQAALRPTVAHALVWHSNPQRTDRFLDPFCGSGTILAERAHYPATRIQGGDISEDTVAVARQNTPPADGAVTVQQWDARSLPIDANAIDKIVTNLPFGRQILPNDDLHSLYAQVLQEFKRVLTRDGVAYVLTNQDEILERSSSAHFHRAVSAVLSLKGTRPKLFRLTPDHLGEIVDGMRGRTQ